MPTDPTTSGLRTTERSLAVVEFVREQGGATLGEVRAGLGMAKSTAYQHLDTLHHHGLLRKQGEQYHVGLRCLNLGENALHNYPGLDPAAEAVDAIAERTGEEVDFFAETAGRAITVHVSYDATNPFREKTVDASDNHWRRGTTYHIHSLAGGKAILSGMDDDAVRAIADRHGLPASTDQTVTDIERLLDELETVRDCGVAISEEEYVDGLCAVARRVDAPDGSVLGSLAVNVPTFRFDGALPDITETLIEEADTLEAALAGASVDTEKRR